MAIAILIETFGNARALNGVVWGAFHLKFLNRGPNRCDVDTEGRKPSRFDAAAQTCGIVFPAAWATACMPKAALLIAGVIASLGAAIAQTPPGNAGNLSRIVQGGQSLNAAAIGSAAEIVSNSVDVARYGNTLLNARNRMFLLSIAANFGSGAAPAAKSAQNALRTTTNTLDPLLRTGGAYATEAAHQAAQTSSLARVDNFVGNVGSVLTVVNAGVDGYSALSKGDKAGAALIGINAAATFIAGGAAVTSVAESSFQTGGAIAAAIRTGDRGDLLNAGLQTSELALKGSMSGIGALLGGAKGADIGSSVADKLLIGVNATGNWLGDKTWQSPLVQYLAFSADERAALEAAKMPIEMTKKKPDVPNEVQKVALANPQKGGATAGALMVSKPSPSGGSPAPVPVTNLKSLGRLTTGSLVTASSSVVAKAALVSSPQVASVDQRFPAGTKRFGSAPPSPSPFESKPAANSGLSALTPQKTQTFGHRADQPANLPSALGPVPTNGLAGAGKPKIQPNPQSAPTAVQKTASILVSKPYAPLPKAIQNPQPPPHAAGTQSATLPRAGNLKSQQTSAVQSAATVVRASSISGRANTVTALALAPQAVARQSRKQLGYSSGAVRSAQPAYVAPPPAYHAPVPRYIPQPSYTPPQAFPASAIYHQPVFNSLPGLGGGIRRR